MLSLLDGRHPSDERGLPNAPHVGMGTDHDRLGVAPTPEPAGLLAQMNHAVTVLVQAKGDVGIGAAGHVFTGHLEVPLPLPMVSAFEPEVEAGPQVEPRVGGDLDGEVTFGPVDASGAQQASEQPTVVVVEPQLGVQERSLSDTTAKVSVIWWLRNSSAGTRGPVPVPVTGPRATGSRAC